MAALFDDPRVAGQLRDIIQQIHDRMNAIFSAMERGTQKVKEEAQKVANATLQAQLDSWKKLQAEQGSAEALKIIAELETRIAEENEKAAKAAKEKLDLARKQEDEDKRTINRWSAFINRMKQEGEDKSTGLRSYMDKLMFGQDNNVDSFTGRTGATLAGIKWLIRSTQDQLFSAMPVGGWIGMLLMGGIANVQDDFIMKQMAHKFRQIGAVTVAETDRLRSTVMSGSTGATRHVVSNQELMETQANFIGAGYGLKDVGAQYTSVLTGLTSRTDIAAATIDKVFSLNNGTAAKAIADFALATGRGVDDATRSIENLARVSVMTGSNFGSLLGVFQQLTTQLRFQSTEVAGLGGLYQKLSGLGSGFKLDAQGSNKLGMDTLGGLVTGVKGLPTGVQKIIGDLIADDLGLGGGRGLSSIYRMQTQFKGEAGAGFDFFTTAVEKMVNFSRKQSGIDGDDVESIAKRSRWLQQVYKLDENTANITARLQTGAGGKFDFSKMTDAERIDLTKARENIEGKTKSPIMLVLEKLSGVLTIGLQLVIQTLTSIYAMLKLGIEGFSITGFSQKTKDAVAANFATTGNTLNEFINAYNAVPGMDPIFKSLSGGIVTSVEGPEKTGVAKALDMVSGPGLFGTSMVAKMYPIVETIRDEILRALMPSDTKQQLEVGKYKVKAETKFTVVGMQDGDNSVGAGSAGGN